MDADCDLSVPREMGSTGNIAGMTLTHWTLPTGTLHSMQSFSRPDGSAVVDSSNIVLFGLNSGSPANIRDLVIFSTKTSGLSPLLPSPNLWKPERQKR